MQFRSNVRSDAWKQDFLARPLTERETIARDLRAQSEDRKATLAYDSTLWADVDRLAARDWLLRARATTLIHGHTHRPARHDLGESPNGIPLQRIVLSDWDANAKSPRLEVLRLDARGLQRVPLSVRAEE
jgi:UDP-2,3-diacylglucosamine hydrolase